MRPSFNKAGRRKPFKPSVQNFGINLGFSLNCGSATNQTLKYKFHTIPAQTQPHNSTQLLHGMFVEPLTQKAEVMFFVSCRQETNKLHMIKWFKDTKA